MAKKDTSWHDQELKKLKEDKKDILGNKGDDYQGTAGDVRNRKKIKEEFRKERRRIKRVEKQSWKKQLEEDLENSDLDIE